MALAGTEPAVIYYSHDQGRTWQLVPGSDGRPNFRRPAAPWIYPDVHSILVHPSSSNQGYAPTGGGFYRSEDGGATWLFYRMAAFYLPAFLISPGSLFYWK